MFDWNKALLCTQSWGIGPHLSARGKFHGFLELWREPGVHSRVTAGVAINNFCFFSDVRTPLYLRSTRQEAKLGLAKQYRPFGGEAGDQGSLSSWHSDIGISIYFQEESGIVTL